MAVCKNDVCHWVNAWCWTYDPRETPTDRPFDLFPKQAEFLTWLRDREDNQEDGLAEKSRDVGFTWLCVVYDVHAWLFRSGYSAGYGSRKLDLVDQIGNPDTIFEKVRYLLRRLPSWMLPAGFSQERHAGYCRIINPANGSTITGEGGDQIGRGGRKTRYTVDEAAYLEHPQLVDAALSQTTRCRIDVSTPNGMGNSFYKKRFGGSLPVFTFHWRDDPRKDDAWYAREQKRLDPVTLAQEVDIDYTASVEGICIPAAWVRAAVDVVLPPVSETYPLVAGFDVAEEGRNRSVYVDRRGPYVGEPESWGRANTTESAWRAARIAESRGAADVYFDPIGVGAGVKGIWESSERKLGFRAVPVNVGLQPTMALWPSGKTSRETFANLKAELWWMLRTRFEKTFEFVTQGVAHPADEMISIPNCPELIAQLSLPLYQSTDTGKIKIESKDALRKRGVDSPDYAEALVLSIAPGPRTMEFF